MRFGGRNGNATETADAVLGRYAEHQYGVFSLDQIRASRLSRAGIVRRVEAGLWERVLPRVYRLRGAGVGWRQSLSAALLWAGDGAAISRHAAGQLWELEGIRRGAVEIVVPFERRTSVVGIECLRSRTLDPRDVTQRAGLRVTTLPRTLIDLAAVLDARQLELALESALRRWRILGWLDRRLAELGGRGSAGSGVLRKLVDARLGTTERTDSPLEVKLLQLSREAGLPPGTLHYDVCDGRYHVAEVDLAWPELRVAVQGDSWANHSGLRAWSRDRDQWSWLASLGWLVLPVTWADLQQRPGEVARRLRRAIEARQRDRPRQVS